MSDGPLSAARETPTAPIAVPASIAPFVAGRTWARDTIGEAGTVVHRIHSPEKPDLYLKYGTGHVADAVVDEMVRMRWLGRYRSVLTVVASVIDTNGAWLLMSAMPGRTAYQCLVTARDDRVRAAIVDALADDLRALHALPVNDCPFDSGAKVRMASARARIDAGLVEEDDFDEPRAGWSAERVWDELIHLRPTAYDRVVTHGDYSLDNILMVEGRVAGLIDLGRVGVADRYQDVAILAHCLDELGGSLRNCLFATYGIVEPDVGRLDFHLCLDEMF